MDHLPTVLNPHRPIQVPYLGGGDYDGQPFAGYPTRRGWNIELLLQGDLQERTRAEAAQFIQTWLYFGMMYELLVLDDGHQIRVEKFIRVDELTRRRLVMTRKLPELLRAWKARLSQQADLNAYVRRMGDCMELAWSVWRQFVEKTAEVSSVLEPEVAVSIQTFASTLEVAVSEIGGFDIFAIGRWRGAPRMDFLVDRMTEDGWCPSVVEQLIKPCQTFLYYASLLGPPKGTGNHRNCSRHSKDCLAKVVNEREYTTRHVSDGCKCDHISVDVSDTSVMARVIDGGDIPIVRLTVQGANISVAVVPHSTLNSLPYTAISHV
jgi:hypothetical protein